MLQESKVGHVVGMSMLNKTNKRRKNWCPDDGPGINYDEVHAHETGLTGLDWVWVWFPLANAVPSALAISTQRDDLNPFCKPHLSEPPN